MFNDSQPGYFSSFILVAFSDRVMQFGCCVCVKVCVCVCSERNFRTVVEGPRDALCQLKSCQLLHSYTKKSRFKRLATGERLKGHSVIATR